MTRRAVSLMVTGATLLATVGLLPTVAQARMCIQRTCVRNAPFTCHGPIGSCGFQQGRCLRYQVTRTFVAGGSCTPDLHVR